MHPRQWFDLRHEILAYLLQHPQAEDTLEGIVSWWLLERKIEFATLEVERTLAALVSQNLLIERNDANSRKHYRVNQSMLDAIRAIVEQGKGS